MSSNPDAHASAVSAVNRPLTGSRTETVTDQTSFGKPYAVPVREMPRRSAWFAEALYRLFEITVALVGLLIGAPFVLIAAALICWDSPGPALFFHRRPARSTIARGRDLEGRSDLRPPPGGYDPDGLYYVPAYFTLCKLRTMYSDARERFPALYGYKFTPENFHQQYPTLKNDPRVTRMGAIMRKLSVDEVPNLWSVLVGDTRLVGPRPEASEVLQYYTPEEMYKFECKPGITGLAQISGRGFLNWGETIAYDLEYVRTRSIALDLKILVTTLKQVIARRGAF
jgi:lipopolysaccharide/colanic/teichoic acid biosynthesis glycosyltransferase